MIGEKRKLFLFSPFICAKPSPHCISSTGFPCPMLQFQRFELFAFRSDLHLVMQHETFKAT